ncbi:L-ascorbate metabolism protein UlaG, beta-lactamase superfamily [Amycolatopsis arida]|uniref:L-ascorbate metabolism protein UlaG, beta-lactamase superfamily n=1 Tax=Amycolatopsis arida TaxID=587909 RepID=A0A1I5KSI4_9PSEU|nr:MBL fold metallo-hydrolase [Amycolatopsis arida]TDX83555.1 L-ascorbate metabolism protein UlaG (beta-lactamase superfamily) [Amycolatopsis arida]SFO87606.1 L-ascorbate metabolism protein UlaG, beta-lactamase superfamily [Amycolatopsis arida]
MAPLSRESTLTFIGTATTLLRLGTFTVLTDPNFLRRGQWAYLGQGMVSRRRTDPAARLADLPRPDVVLLSHLHGDHFDRVARRELPADVPVLTTAAAARRLGRRGFRNAAALPTWSTETLADGGAALTITAVPARHSTGPLVRRVLPPVMGSVLEYVATPGAEPLRIYVSGDTVLHDELRGIRERFPRLDLAVLHLGGARVLGALVSMDDRQGVDLLELLRPAHAVPVHFDDYPMFASPVSNFLAEAARRCQGGTAVRLLQRGERLPLPPPAVLD